MTTKRLVISGRSDDLIEVDGDFSDEFGGPGYVELSTGDVFRVDYEDNGCWNVIHYIKTKLLSSVTIVRKEEEDDDGYTGYAEIAGPIAWIDGWYHWPPESGAVQDRLADRLDMLSLHELMRAYHAATGRSCRF